MIHQIPNCCFKIIIDSYHSRFRSIAKYWNIDIDCLMNQMEWICIVIDSMVSPNIESLKI